MSNLREYICVEDLVAKMEEPANALSEVTSLGLEGKLDFFIVLENVHVIWFAVFNGNKDCCGLRRTTGMELFKITAKSLENLVVASKGQVSRVIQLELEVPIEIKNEYKFQPDYFTAELRKFSQEDSLNINTSTMDGPTKQSLSVKDVYHKMETEKTTNDIFPELRYPERENIVLPDNTYWEHIGEEELMTLLGRNILQLWVPRKQATIHFKKNSEIKEQIPCLPDDGRPKLYGIKNICKFYIKDIKQEPFPEEKLAKDFNQWKGIRTRLQDHNFLMGPKGRPWTTPLAMETVFFMKKSAISC